MNAIHLIHIQIYMMNNGLDLNKIGDVRDYFIAETIASFATVGALVASASFGLEFSMSTGIVKNC